MKSTFGRNPWNTTKLNRRRNRVQSTQTTDAKHIGFVRLQEMCTQNTLHSVALCDHTELESKVTWNEKCILKVSQYSR